MSMTKEQEETIEILEHIKKEFKGNTKAPNINTRNIATKKIQAIETVLSMLKENSAEIMQKNTELAEKNAEIERLNRQIDLMADFMIGGLGDIAFNAICKKSHCTYELKDNRPTNFRKCKLCIKQYFERKATNNG